MRQVSDSPLPRGPDEGVAETWKMGKAVVLCLGGLSRLTGPMGGLPGGEIVLVLFPILVIFFAKGGCLISRVVSSQDSGSRGYRLVL